MDNPEVLTRKQLSARNRKAPSLRTPKHSKLKTKVLELLQDTPFTLAEIAEACDVSVPWIARLKGPHGDTLNPSVDRMEELYEFLSGKELTL